ncbi:alpha-mannosidase, partial [bacterium]
MNVLRSGLPLALAFLAGGAYAQKPPVKRDLNQGNTLYVVPYSHLDTQWRWAYPQVLREYIPATMRDNLALIAKYPNYTFNFSGSRRYEMMREYYPADYAKVVAAVKAGRWFPCGSSVDEGDANVPSGESLVRHILYGNHWFRRELGVASQEFMLPDCFGFPYALPSILAHCGLTGFSTQKLTWGSSAGIPFKVGVWKGPDGKSVVAALDPGAYTGQITEDLSQNTSWLARIRNTGMKSGAFVDYHYYGTGDRGGAPGESSVDWIERSIAGKGPISVVSARADEMFLNVTPAQRAKMPTYDGELLLTEHSAGSITSQAYMKRWNRKNEWLADAAERASVGAMWLGGADYPSQRLEKAWELVLGSQMHDMLPGTSLPKAYEHCWNDEILAMNSFAEIERHGVATIAAAMDTRGEGIPLVVYNPLGRAREELVTMENPADQAWTVLGPDGKMVPSQMIKGKLLFTAKVPANGFVAYTLQGFPDKPTGIAPAVDDARTIENDRLKVTIDRNGDIGSIYDKTAKREVLRAPAR